MTLATNYRKKKNGKRTNIWRANSMLLKKKKRSTMKSEEIRKYLETNENGNITFQSWDASKTLLRGKFIEI